MSPTSYQTAPPRGGPRTLAPPPVQPSSDDHGRSSRSGPRPTSGRRGPSLGDRSGPGKTGTRAQPPPTPTLAAADHPGGLRSAAPPTLMGLHGPQALHRIPCLAPVDPGQVGEDHSRVRPPPLSPGAQAQAVKRPVEGTVVDEASREHPGEAFGEGLFGDRHGRVVPLQCILWALAVKGDVAQMNPCVDASVILRDQVLKDATGVAVVPGAVQFGGVGHGVDVPVLAPIPGMTCSISNAGRVRMQ